MKKRNNEKIEVLNVCRVILKLYSEGFTVKDIALIYGYSEGLINLVLGHWGYITAYEDIMMGRVNVKGACV